MKSLTCWKEVITVSGVSLMLLGLNIAALAS